MESLIMLNIKIISVGGLKEQYLRDAVAEYIRRLSSFCALEIIEIKESRLPDDPSARQISSAMEDEGKRILAAIPPRSYVAALCIEGKQFSSEELAAKISEISSLSGTLCFIIGGSNGLSEEIKNLASLKLSFSKLTFPHQLMRVILCEAIYRSFNILKGTKYHK
jgi:23S rRNA (pseudouridine1915-N3)-methyltransferase